MYRILGLPDQLFTPMFAVARMVGWSAHRLEELMNCDKIIRPAYQSVAMDKDMFQWRIELSWNSKENLNKAILGRK